MFQLVVILLEKFYCTLIIWYFSLKYGQFTLTCFQPRIPYYNTSTSWTPGVPCGESQRQQKSRKGHWPTAWQRLLPKAAKLEVQCNRNVHYSFYSFSLSKTYFNVICHSNLFSIRKNGCLITRLHILFIIQI